MKTKCFASATVNHNHREAPDSAHRELFFGMTLASVHSSSTLVEKRKNSVMKRPLGLLFAAVLGNLVNPYATAQPAGGLSVVSAVSGVVSMCAPGRACGGDVWKDVPGLSTSVHSRAGDNLAISVSAEIMAPANVMFRALVDGTPASPSDVVFKLAGDYFDGVRSFTFVRGNVADGRHVVQIQWSAHQTWSSSDTGPGPDTTPQIGDRTLTVNSAGPTSEVGRLAVVAAPSSDWIVKTTSAWEDIPNLSTTITTTMTTNLEITFSAETLTDRGSFFARALVDGQADSDVLFDNASSATRTGTRSFTFIRKSVSPGTHDIRLQWGADGSGASIRVADRTVAAYASPASAAGGGLVAAAVQSAPINLSTSWTDVPDMSTSFNTTDPSTNVRIAFGAQMSVRGGRMFVRALIDGAAISPSDVVFVSKGSELRTESFTFVEKNILPGTHSVRIQAYVDAGASGSLSDRSVSALFKHRDGGDFGQPYPRPGMSETLKPRHGRFPLLVICFDIVRPGMPPPTADQVKDVFLGNDGNVAVTNWFQENSDGAFGPDPITFLGCSDGNWLKPPQDHQGGYYGMNNAWDQMYQDGIDAAANAGFDFRQYDHNGDNYISGDELVVTLLKPQDGTDGFRRSGTMMVNGRPLGFDILDVYMSPNNGARRLNVGLVSHEMSHLVLNAADMYTPDSRGHPDYSGFTTSPGYYSLMANHQNANHLDPFHKLKSAFLIPDVVEVNTLTTELVTLAAVEESHRMTIIYDPARKDREYFIIENRWGGPASAPNYDSTLPAGVVVWHIIEDLALANQYLPPGVPSTTLKVGYPTGADEWGRIGVRLLRVLSTSGEDMDLAWASGTPSNIHVTLASAPNELVRVMISASGTTPLIPDLTVSNRHTGDFTQGQTGATYTIQVSNSGTISTSGTVQVSDTLPAGLTATAMAGTGWFCYLSALNCSRNDALSALASYPPITLTVNVATNAPATVTNTAAVTGGGETNTTNNIAGDVTTIRTPVQPPVITAQPASAAACSGQPVTFSVSATGAALTYQWRKNGTDIAGATASSYGIASTTPTNAGTYDVVVRNSAGNVTSASASLTVNTAATITSQPVSLTRAPSQSATFSVTATGTNLLYQWRGPNGGNIPGATSSTYTIPNVTTANAGSYYVVVFNGCGQVTSSSAVLSVTSAGNQARFVIQSLPVTALGGGRYGLTAGQSYDVSLTMENYGTTTWTAANGYALVSQAPIHNTTWGISRVELPGAVAPGSRVVFRFRITAPVTSGDYRYSWQMMQGSVGFGSFAPDFIITVTP